MPVFVLVMAHLYHPWLLMLSAVTLACAAFAENFRGGGIATSSGLQRRPVPVWIGRSFLILCGLIFVLAAFSP